MHRQTADIAAGKLQRLHRKTIGGNHQLTTLPRQYNRIGVRIQQGIL